MDVHVRKAQAGADSFGNNWPEDGAVVEVPYEQAMALLAIKDGQFSVVDEPNEEPDDGDEGTDGKDKELSEINPDAPSGEPTGEKPADSKAAPAKKTAARKTAASKSVEEG